MIWFRKEACSKIGSVEEKSFLDLTKDLTDPYQWYFYNTDMEYGIV